MWVSMHVDVLNIRGAPGSSDLVFHPSSHLLFHLTSLSLCLISSSLSASCSFLLSRFLLLLLTFLHHHIAGETVTGWTNEVRLLQKVTRGHQSLHTQVSTATLKTPCQTCCSRRHLEVKWDCPCQCPLRSSIALPLCAMHKTSDSPTTDVEPVRYQRSPLDPLKMEVCSQNFTFFSGSHALRSVSSRPTQLTCSLS